MSLPGSDQEGCPRLSGCGGTCPPTAAVHQHRNKQDTIKLSFQASHHITIIVGLLVRVRQAMVSLLLAHGFYRCYCFQLTYTVRAQHSGNMLNLSEMMPSCRGGHHYCAGSAHDRYVLK